MSDKLSIIITDYEMINTELFTTAWSLGPYEIICIIKDNHSDNLVRAAENFGCKIVVAKNSDNNHGYIAGLKKSSGDILLFLSGNVQYQSVQLQSLLQPLRNGTAQVVLNNLDTSFLKKQALQWPDSYTLWRQVFNDVLDNNQLHIDSLLSTPHAYKREVVQSIGYESFENLAVAQMRIFERGWTISRPISINTNFSGDLITKQGAYYNVPLSEIEKSNIMTFLKALQVWFKTHVTRGNYHDGGRRRDLINMIKNGSNLSSFSSLSRGYGTKSSLYNGKQLSVIIPAQNEAATIAAVITEARKIEPLEIIVVVNGSTDGTEIIAKQLGATVIVFPEPLGIDTGRSIGALAAKGEILLFIDADFQIHANDLFPYCSAVANGVDVALNDLNIDQFPLYIVNLYKYLLNMACNRKELGVGSIVAVPHAISKSCLEGIGWDSLLNPCLAHVKAIVKGYQVSNVHFVDVMKPNRIRPDQHLSYSGHPKAVLRINGDHLEAIRYLLEHQK